MQIFHAFWPLLLLPLAVFVALVLVVLVFAAWRRRSERKLRIPDTGVVLVEGLPGSGKSFFGVELVLTRMLRDRRPVYTNLPLRFRVVRQYLRNRGGERLASLIVHLPRQHFLNFLDRHAQRVEFRKVWRESRESAGRAFSERDFQRAWEAEAGPDVLVSDPTKGEYGNWIPETAVVVIDEVHDWFPAEAAMPQRRTETPNLRKWLTEIRHSQQELWVITQNRMQVSVTIRRLVHYWWHVRNRADDRIAWGIRLGHLGVRAFGYWKMTAQGEEGKGWDPTPVDQLTVFPWLPSKQVIFRLYNSFSHVGNRRALMRKLEAVRASSGLLPDGSTPEERVAQEEAEAVKREARKPWRLMTWAGRWAVRLGVLWTVFVIGTAWGGGRVPSSDAVVQPAATVPSASAQPQWGRWQSFGDEYVRVDGTRVDVGRSHDGAMLLDVDRDLRMSLWGIGDVYWLWRFGDPEPKRLGTMAEIHAARARVLGRSGRAWGTGVIAETGQVVGAVEFAGGQPGGDGNPVSLGRE